MIFTGLEHTWIHNLMRPLPYKPYFIFPTRGLAQAVYIPSPSPRFLLVESNSYYVLKYTREDRNPLKALEEKFAPLAKEGQELADRLGCPVACVFIMEDFEEKFWKQLWEMAESYRITVALGGYERPGEFMWYEPATLSEHPPLPPYPKSWDYAEAHRLDWWREEISKLEKLEGHERKKHARFLFSAALQYLKESPARMLVEGTKALEIAREFLPRFPSLLVQKAGQRYVYWLSFYFAAVCVIGRTITTETDLLAYDFLQYLMQKWEQASSQEKRMIMRGLELLAEKSATYLLPADSPVMKFLHSLFPWAVEQLKSKEARGWGFEWRVLNLLEKLGLYGYVSPSMIEDLSKQSLRWNSIVLAMDAIIDYFLLHPSRELWRAMLNNFPQRELRLHIESRLFSNWWSEEFWQLAVEDDDLLKITIEVSIERLANEKSYLPHYSRPLLNHLLLLSEQREVELEKYTREDILQRLRKALED